MNTRLLRTATALLALAEVARAQGTAFTYQGRLNDGGAPAQGIYDLRFTIYDAASAGAQQGGTVINAATAVSNGLFTVTLDFGNQFSGANRWLEIGVRSNGGGAFSLLTPRQQITATPYAVQSANAATALSVSGSVAASQLTGAISSNNLGAGTITGSKLANGAVGSAQIADGGVAAADLAPTLGVWSKSGNHLAHSAGSVGIGTTNPQTSLHVYSTNFPTALRLQSAPSFGFGAGRLEFYSDPQGGGSEWRPGFIESADNGGFTGALSFHVNGAGFDNRLGDTEVMRLVNGRVGIGTATPASALDVSGDLTVRGNFTVPNGQVVKSFNGQTDQVTLTAGNGLEVVGNQMRVQPGGTIAAPDAGPHSTLAITAPPRGFWAGVRGLEVLVGTSWLTATADTAVHAVTEEGNGVLGASRSGRGIWGYSQTGHAGFFNGRVAIQGDSFFSSRSVLEFGSQTRQMIDLWGGVYGIGVQSGTHYFRTGSGGGDRFAWFQGGTHSDTALDPGAGGMLLMSLDRSYLTLRGNGDEQPYIGGDGFGGDIEIGSRNAGVMNVGFWNSAAGQHMNVFGQNFYGVSFNPSSDRNAKQDFKPVEATAILEKVVALPISEWAYKGEADTRHLGPVAQDFKAAFGVGSSDKSIATVDADGVALAAIQGLNQKLEDKESRIQTMERELAALKEIVTRLSNQRE